MGQTRPVGRRNLAGSYPVETGRTSLPTAQAFGAMTSGSLNQNAAPVPRASAVKNSTSKVLSGLLHTTTSSKRPETHDSSAEQ
jgi:hypothetical protein